MPDLSDLDVDDLKTKLNEAEHNIRGVLNNSVPELKVQLPRFNEDMFSKKKTQPRTSFRRPQVPDVNVNAPELPDSAPLLDPENQSQSLAAVADPGGVPNPTLPIGELPDAAGEVTSWKAKAKEYKAEIVSTATSLVNIVISAVLGLPPIAMLVVNAILSTVSFMNTLRKEAYSIRGTLLGHFEAAIDEVLQFAEKAKQTLLGMSGSVEAQIDQMTNEQKPALDKAAQAEKVLGIDLPDPDDLKRPLDVCEAKLEAIIAEVKESLPKQLHSQIEGLSLGKVVFNESTFGWMVVYLPTVLMLLFNLAVAVTMAASQTGGFEWARASSPAAAPSEVEFGNVPRLLRGAGTNHTNSIASTGSALDHLAQTPSSSEAAAAAGIDWVKYLMPGLTQIALMFLQMGLVAIFAQASRVIPVANGAIASVEDSASKSINDKMKGAVDSVLAPVFSEVDEKCNDFFPKLNDVLEKLQKFT